MTYGDRTVASFRWSTTISRDPVITFRLRADREAPLTMTWRDNRAIVYQTSVPIGFSAV